MTEKSKRVASLSPTPPELCGARMSPTTGTQVYCTESKEHKGPHKCTFYTGNCGCNCNPNCTCACHEFFPQELSGAAQEEAPRVSAASRAIEHGGYLADAVDAYLAERNRFDERAADEDKDPNGDVGAQDSLNDHIRSLRSRSYEFRKRAERVGVVAEEEAGAPEPQEPK